VFFFHFLEGRSGEDVDHAAFGVQFGDGVLADILSACEFGRWDDGVRLRVDHDAHFQFLLSALEFFGFRFHFPADAAALPIGFALLGFLDAVTRRILPSYSFALSESQLSAKCWVVRLCVSLVSRATLVGSMLPSGRDAPEKWNQA
jgi:hypothetical protein